ncbi:MAG: class I SAM-dependent methyltransferase [Thermomicrobiaceae bacterium]
MITRVRRSILTRIFQVMYGLGEWIYDPLTAVFFGPAWHNWRRTVIPFVGNGPVLEIACGTGQLLPELNSRSSLVVGIDYSDSMLRPARRRVIRSGVEAEIVQADARRIPFVDGTFETVVSTFPASFLANESTLDEIARVLRPGGRLVVVVSARFTNFQWRRPLIHPILRLAYGSTSSMNRWPDDMLSHPELPGEWQDLRSPEGEAFVWIARKSE